jgi:hypothetical protein
MRSAKSLLSIPLVILALAAASAEQTSRSVAIRDHGRLEFSHPKAWKFFPGKPAPEDLPIQSTMTLEHNEGQRFVVQMTPIISPDGRPVTQEVLRRMIEGRGQHDLKLSGNGQLEVKELKGEAARGYYYSLGDEAAKPGDFKYLTGVVVGVGNLLLNVTIFDNDPKLPQRQQALEMVKGAKQIGAATQPATRPAKQLRVAAPNGKFELVMDQRDLQMLDEQTHEKSKSIMAANEDGWAVSIFLEPAAKAGDAKVARTFYEERMKRSPLPREELTMGGDTKKATTQYVIKDLEQKNINVYMVNEGYWIDVHISKTEFAPPERKMFDELVGSIRVEPVGKK